MDYLKIANEFFKTDRYAMKTTGIKIDAAEPGFARCSMEIEDKHLNALNNVMGGAMFTLADFAFAVATNVDGSQVVTLTSQMSFIGTPKGKKLIAEARNVKTGRTACFYLAEIRDELGTPIATVNITGYKKK